MPRFSSSVRALVGSTVVAAVASVGLSATPASADEMNSVPPNRIEQTYYSCTGGDELVQIGSGMQWSDPETWQAYTNSTETTSADGSEHTRMDYYRGVNTYAKFYQCYDRMDRYILAPETTLTKRYTITTKTGSGGVAVLYSGWSGWY